MTESISDRNKNDVIVLSNAYPFGNGETFLETELPYLIKRFSRIFLLPMFAEGVPRSLHKNIYLLSASPPSVSKTAEFLRGIIASNGLLYSEWKSSPAFPASAYGLYLVARTLGIARRIETRILQEVKLKNIQNGIIYSYWMNQASIGGILAANKLGWPVISRAHGGDLYTERYPNNYLPWHQWKIRNLDYIFPVFEFGSRYLQHKYPPFADKIIVQKLGVAGHDLLKHNPGTRHTIHIASCSSIIPLKRVDRILQTIAVLSTMLSGHKIRWTHIGSGPLANQLRRRADAIRASNLDIRLTGHMANNDIIPYYVRNEVDLFFNFSTSEGIPVTIMEAFSCGIPAVAPNTGGIPEIVDDSTGILFETEDSPESVAARICSCIKSNQLALKSSNARLKWEKEYHQEKNYTHFLDFLSELGNRKCK